MKNNTNNVAFILATVIDTSNQSICIVFQNIHTTESVLYNTIYTWTTIHLTDDL